jgi:hypothetical protein
MDPAIVGHSGLNEQPSTGSRSDRCPFQVCANPHTGFFVDKGNTSEERLVLSLFAVTQGREQIDIQL